MRICLDGPLGGGKTVLAVKLLREWPVPKPIISNIHLKFDHEFLSDHDCVMFLKTHMEDTQAIYEKFHDKIWLIDEIYNVLDARGSAGSSINQIMTAMIMMAGKINLDIIYTCQLSGSQADVRLRETTDIYYKCCRIVQDPTKDIDPNARKLRSPVLIFAKGTRTMGVFGEMPVFELFDPDPYYGLYETGELVFCDRIKLAMELKR